MSARREAVIHEHIMAIKPATPVRARIAWRQSSLRLERVLEARQFEISSGRPTQHLVDEAEG